MAVFRFPLVLTILGFLLPGVGWSAVSDINDFPDAGIDLKESGLVNSYPIIGSNLKKVNGQVTADSEKWLNGYLERKLFLIPNGRSSEQAFQYFRDQFLALGVAPLFECDRFSCGESNFWANNIFNIARLYGLDKAQFYFVGSRLEAGKTVYYLAYTVRRGNKREYALVDVFTEGASRRSHSQQYDIVLPISDFSFKSSDAYKKILGARGSSNTVLITLSSASIQSTAELKSKQKQLQKARDRIAAILKAELSEQQIVIQAVIGQNDTDTLDISFLSP